MLIVNQSRRLLPMLATNRRRQQAARYALQQLQQTDAVQSQPGSILRHYLDTRFNQPFLSTTPAECEQQLRSHGLDPQLAGRVARCLEQCDGVAFAHPPQTVEDCAPLREAVMTEIKALEAFANEKAHRQKLNARHLLMSGILFALAAMTLTTAAATREQTFEAERALNILLSANNPADFRHATEAMATLIDEGAANASLFYNYGTTALMAGDAQTALLALRRAERYSGTTWSISRNMRLARHMLNPDIPDTPPWQRIPLFWHYRLPAQTRMTIAAFAFSAVWILVLVGKQKRWHDQILITTWVMSAACLLFGASVLASIYGEHEARLQHAERLPTLEADVTEKEAS
jgi:hypothetical protein